MFFTSFRAFGNCEKSQVVYTQNLLSLFQHYIALASPAILPTTFRLFAEILSQVSAPPIDSHTFRIPCPDAILGFLLLASFFPSSFPDVVHRFDRRSMMRSRTSYPR